MDAVANDFSVEEEEARIRVLREAVISYGTATGGVNNLNKETVKSVSNEEKLSEMLFQTVMSFQMDYAGKQAYLEANFMSKQFDIVMEFLSREIEINKIKEEIRLKVKERVDKNQRDYILREQMKVIREELGEDDSVSDADRFLEELKNLNASNEVKEKLKKRLSDLSQ